MVAHETEASPQVYARIGGWLYLIIIVAGLFGEAFVRDKLIVSGDAMATARNLRSSELLWRLGIAGNLVHLSCAVALALVFYVLLRPVSKNLALLATFFGLVSITLEAASKLVLIAALFPLGKAEYLKVFQPEQLAALAYLSIKSHGFGFGVSLIFFGWACLVLGYLIFRSGYLPRVIGVLMQIAGVCYLVNSFALILAPKVADLLFPAVLVPAFIGEASFCVWLIVKGVNVEKWKLKADGGLVRG
ncbi:MAG TPA: DUF4386 domain-containing protein [Thermoanaerobaculia bacterium]|nr:DUF4386 domain-containing protein [Thermoanaerobaculia bacterium]